MSGSDKIIMVHLTSDDHIRAGKAIRFAKNSLSRAEEVVLYTSAHGVNIINRSAGGFTMPGTDINSLDALREFIKDGGRVYAGKDCMKAQGIAATDILAGCENADEDATFSLVLSDDVKMITW